MENDLVEFSKKFLEQHLNQTPMVVVTMTNIKGSAPQDLGAKMIVTSTEIIFGTVGGGRVEKQAIDFSRGLLSKTGHQKPQSQTWNLQKDLGMTCGGEVSFLFEPLKMNSAWNIAIFGAGHVSQELVRALLNLNCNIRVFDTRSEWLDRFQSHPKLKVKLCKNDMSEEIAHLEENSFIVVVTMGHSTDTPVAHKALLRGFPYLGVIGSQSKRNTLEKSLLALGNNKEQLKTIICPIGEKIGTSSPAEIAISITAQLLKIRDK